MGIRRFNFGYNRYMCDVLDEMRKCKKTHNYSYLEGLIEEVQSMGNRMESALGKVKEYNEMLKHYDKLKKKIRELERDLPSEKEES